jgi:hypothetical protein
MPKKSGFSFSQRRALGIPLTRSGFDRKIGRSVTTGCGVWVMVGVVVIGVAVVRSVGG